MQIQRSVFRCTNIAFTKTCLWIVLHMWMWMKSLVCESYLVNVFIFRLLWSCKEYVSDIHYCLRVWFMFSSSTHVCVSSEGHSLLSKRRFLQQLSSSNYQKLLVNREYGSVLLYLSEVVDVFVRIFSLHVCGVYTNFHCKIASKFHK